MTSSKFVIALMALAASTVSAAAELDEAPTSPWSIQISGTAQHFHESKNHKHQWNQQNWGLGLEYEQHDTGSTWTRGYSLGSLKDSYGAGGAYAAATELKNVGTVLNTRFEAGVGAFAFWRTFGWNGEHRLAVVPLPVVHIEEQHTGIGLNLVIAPPLYVHSKTKEMPGFAFFQLTKRF